MRQDASFLLHNLHQVSCRNDKKIDIGAMLKTSYQVLTKSGTLYCGDKIVFSKKQPHFHLPNFCAPKMGKQSNYTTNGQDDVVQRDTHKQCPYPMLRSIAVFHTPIGPRLCKAIDSSNSNIYIHMYPP